MRNLEVTPPIDAHSENLAEHIDNKFFQARDPLVIMKHNQIAHCSKLSR